ncbi:MAG: rRNA (cytosine967-C5)-methyltransferase, partial [Sphingomonadales bacterium]|nr:rRNA (cytosine967-C5)-methyltransferase [Sphingomonadales bacterium]
MTPAARLQAAIEVLDEVIASARDDGPPADTIVTRYFKRRRYAGSKDRRAVRELVFRAIRRSAERPVGGRAAMLGLVDDERELAALFGQPRGPDPIAEGETPAPAGAMPDWLRPELSSLVEESEWPALLERAPLDLRVNISRASRDELLAQFDGGTATPLSPWGIRLPLDSRIDDHHAYTAGLVEVQDEGSQLIALACEPDEGDRVLDLCAGAGGKSLALAAAAPAATILATDSNRGRLAKLEPRAQRAGAQIETRLLSPPRELDNLADWREAADLVLVDAPCSGSGTWR